MSNNLLLVFEDTLFEIYNEKATKNYLLFIKKKVDYFIQKLDLNLFLAVNNKYLNRVKDVFDNSLILNYEKNIKSLLMSYSLAINEYQKNNSDDLDKFTLVLSASYPFYSFEKNEFILLDSQKYLVDYYYGENFPEGIVGEVFKNSILSDLIKLSNENDYYHQNIFFDILLRNISMFDIDLIEGFDYYLPYRISISISSYSSLPLIANIAGVEEFNLVELTKLDFLHKADFKIEWNNVENKLKEKQNLYTIPKTYILEISSKCNFSCIHCLYPEGLKRNCEYIDKNLLFNFIEKNKDYTIDSIFIIGGFGEPFMHPDFFEIINFLSQKNKVYIETNGSFLSHQIFDKFSNPTNVILVVSIDAIKEETYKKLNKKMILSMLLNTITKLLEKYPENIYISFLRIPQNDDELEEFYAYFQKYEKNIIFRKFNSYSKKLPDLEVAELTPVERFPCYHLRREIFILSDGRISLCYSDFDGSIPEIDITTPINQIIEKMKHFYFQHCQESYPQICKECNEFYTYFF